MSPVSAVYSLVSDRSRYVLLVDSTLGLMRGTTLGWFMMKSTTSWSVASSPYEPQVQGSVNEIVQRERERADKAAFPSFVLKAESDLIAFPLVVTVLRATVRREKEKRLAFL